MTGIIQHEEKSTGNTDNLHPIKPPWVNRLLLWSLPLLFLLVFFFYPFSRILVYSFSIESFKLPNLQLAFHVLFFTLYRQFYLLSSPS
jgi:hypothetical protein